MTIIRMLSMGLVFGFLLSTSPSFAQSSDPVTYVDSLLKRMIAAMQQKKDTDMKKQLCALANSELDTERVANEVIGGNFPRERDPSVKSELLAAYKTILPAEVVGLYIAGLNVIGKGRNHSVIPEVDGRLKEGLRYKTVVETGTGTFDVYFIISQVGDVWRVYNANIGSIKIVEQLATNLTQQARGKKEAFFDYVNQRNAHNDCKVD